jgi:hypothetical protein
VRFFVAMFAHETDMLSTLAIDRRRFAARDVRRGGELAPAIVEVDL